MDDRQRTVREFTPDEREHWMNAVAEAEAEAPELIERDRLTGLACAEQNVNGQLRRAAVASRIDYATLASRAGLSVRDVGEFMCGRSTLDSDAFARLSAILNLQLASLP